MGILGTALANGAAYASRAASETLETATKFAYMGELENARAMREENLARLRGSMEMEREEYSQQRQDERSSAESGQKVMGYLNGKPVTNDEFKSMPTEDQANVVNSEAYRAQLTQETESAREGGKFIGQDGAGRAYTRTELDDYKESHKGAIPKGFQTNEQIESGFKARDTAAREKQADAAMLSARKSGAGGEKPLTKQQKLAAGAKATSMLQEARKNDPYGEIPGDTLDVINSYRIAAGQNPLVPVQKEIIPAKKHWWGTDKATYGTDYVPASQAGSGSGGLIGSAAQSQASNSLSGKPAGRYRVNGQIVKWNGRQVIQ